MTAQYRQLLYVHLELYAELEQKDALCYLNLEQVELMRTRGYKWEAIANALQVSFQYTATKPKIVGKDFSTVTSMNMVFMFSEVYGNVLKELTLADKH